MKCPFEIRNGTPSASEYNGLWKNDPNDPDVTDDEYDKAYSDLENWIVPYKKPLKKSQPRCYVRGDNFGDRTQYVEIYDLLLLTREFVMHLQEWTKTYGLGMWRIVISVSVDVAIMIYPSVIRMPEKYEYELSSALFEMIAELKDNR